MIGAGLGVFVNVGVGVGEIPLPAVTGVAVGVAEARGNALAVGEATGPVDVTATMGCSAVELSGSAVGESVGVGVGVSGDSSPGGNTVRAGASAAAAWTVAITRRNVSAGVEFVAVVDCTLRRSVSHCSKKRVRSAGVIVAVASSAACTFWSTCATIAGSVLPWRAK